MEVGGGGGDEVDEAGAAVEFGEKEGGVGLGFRRRNPIEARAESAVFNAAFSEDSAPVAAHSHNPADLFYFILIISRNKREREITNKGCERREEKAIY